MGHPKAFKRKGLSNENGFNHLLLLNNVGNLKLKFTQHKEDCGICLTKVSQETSNVKHGVTESQLNLIYN